MMYRHLAPLNQMIQLLAVLLGIGQRQAEKIAFDLINTSEEGLRENFSRLLAARQQLRFCAVCGALVSEKECEYCDIQGRDCSYLAVVATVRDLLQIEEGREYNGMYHVLGGLLAPSRGISEEDLHLATLGDRIERLQVQELIFAIDSTVEGEATSQYIAELVQDQFPHVKMTRLAYGVPVGVSFDRVDVATLARAFSARKGF
jgi:recombination protein RecR